MPFFSGDRCSFDLTPGQPSMVVGQTKLQKAKISFSPFLLIGFLFISAGSVGSQTTPEQHTPSFEDRVISVILNRPEVVLVALQKIEEERKQRDLAATRTKVSESADSLFGPDGSADIVEFFDYRCGFCSRAAQDIRQVATKYPGRVRLVELPILGPVSEELSRFSLAVKALYGEASYTEFHHALIAPGVANGGIVGARRVAAIFEMDIDAIDRKAASSDITDEIAQNRILARTLGISGTPAFVSKSGVHSGMQSIEALEAMIIKKDQK